MWPHVRLTWFKYHVCLTYVNEHMWNVCYTCVRHTWYIPYVLRMWIQRTFFTWITYVSHVNCLKLNYLNIFNFSVHSWYTSSCCLNHFNWLLSNFSGSLETFILHFQLLVNLKLELQKKDSFEIKNEFNSLNDYI